MPVAEYISGKFMFFYFYPVYLNTLTISLSPPTSWQHLFIIPVSEKPHFSMTLPDAGLPVKWSAQMFSKCFTWMHQLQGFGADSLVPIRLSYPVTHLAVVFSDRDVAGFMGVVADATDCLASLFQHNRPCRVIVEISLDNLPTSSSDLCAGHPARGPTSGSEVYLKSASASDSC